MSLLRRLTLPSLAAALAAASLAATPAFAGGGSTSTPPPATGSYCPQDPDAWVVLQPDGSTIFANEASGAGCVFVRSYPAGYLRLDSVTLAPGWTYVVKKNGCVYDLTLIAPPRAYDTVADRFVAFVSGFAALGAGRER